MVGWLSNECVLHLNSGFVFVTWIRFKICHFQLICWKSPSFLFLKNTSEYLDGILGRPLMWLTQLTTCKFISSFQPGLPDGFFSDQKSQFEYILVDLEMENVVIYSGHIWYFTTIGYILWVFENFVVIWYIFIPLWFIEPRKIWQPCFQGRGSYTGLFLSLDKDFFPSRTSTRSTMDQVKGAKDFRFH
jgi:hypothetical protein